MKENLGTKRQCPKCEAKFYDFGATDTVSCPKCGKSWKASAEKKARRARLKKELPVAKKVPAPKREDDELGIGLPEGVEEAGEIEELEPIEDEGVELISLEEVEEHEEEEANPPNSDDAEDEMFTELSGEAKLVDDLEEYIEKDEEEDGDEEE